MKKRYSAFFGTNLHSVPTNLNVTRIVLAGVNTHACTRATAVDAYQRDYSVVIPRECVASYDDHHHEVSLDYMDGAIAAVISLESLIPETKREND